VKTINIPFNQFVGLQKSDNPDFVLELAEDRKYENHLATVHASAQFALAEAASGEYLLNNFRDQYKGVIVPVVRRVETKYKKPAKGKLYANAVLDDETATMALTRLKEKGRALFPVEVSVVDQEGTITMTGTVEWFVQAVTAE